MKFSILEMMLRLIVVLIVFFLGVSDLAAQDLVVTNTLDSIECKIEKLSADTFYIVLRKGNVEVKEKIERSKVSHFIVDYKNAIPEVKPPIEPTSYPKVRIAIAGGMSNLIGRVPNNIPQEYIPYVQELKSGNFFGADISIYESEHIGMGVKYSMFQTSNQLNDVSFVDSTGATIYGLLKDDITVQYIGPALAIRHTLPRGSAYFVSHLSIGMLSYVNDATVIDKIKLSGKTVAFSGDVGLDFQILDGLYFGLVAGVTFGVLKELKVEADGIVDILDLSELEYSNASRIDLGIGLRYFW
ncbi:MAG: hypothetical protein JKX73_08520 [Flavobacteriales bacterium]|nr:hypothetical protein [Flavobacteriales bacterium]